MPKQNVNKANKTAEIHASCHVVGYVSDQDGSPVLGLPLYLPHTGPEPRWERKETFIDSLFFRNELAKLATKGEFLVAKVTVLVATCKIYFTYHNGMHSSYSCTGKHSNHQLNDHWHVDCNTVSFLDAYKKQAVNSFFKLLIKVINLERSSANL